MQQHQFQRTVDLYGTQLTVRAGAVGATTVNVNGFLPDGRGFQKLMWYDHADDMFSGNGEMMAEIMNECRLKASPGYRIFFLACKPFQWILAFIRVVLGGLFKHFSKPSTAVMAGGFSDTGRLMGMGMCLVAIGFLFMAAMAWLAVAAGLFIIYLGVNWFYNRGMAPKVIEVRDAGQAVAWEAFQACQKAAE